MPPGGWTLVRKPGTTIATAPGATMAVTTYDRLSKSRSRDDVLREVAADIGVDLSTPKRLPKRPHKRQPVGNVTVSLYQFEKTRRLQQEGTLVIFTTDRPSDAAVMGMAFVANDDQSAADQAVVRAIESLHPPVSQASPEPPAVQKARLPSTEPTNVEPNLGLDLHPL